MLLSERFVPITARVFQAYDPILALTAPWCGLSWRTVDLVDAHIVNPIIAPRFRAIDQTVAKQHAFEFFCMESGGSEPYTGRDLREVHTGMNLSEQEYLAAVDDLMVVMEKNNIGEQERKDVLFIFFSLKGEVLRI